MMPRRLAALAVTAALALGVPSPGRADEPLRSGTILAGSADSEDYTWVWAFPGCGGSPECWAWQDSGCDAGFAGRNPAVMTSIEVVHDLADGLTNRTLEARTAGPRGVVWGDIVVEFWDRNCGFIPHTDARYQVPCSGGCPTFVVPRNARWMTITSKPDGPIVEWTLT